MRRRGRIAAVVLAAVMVTGSLTLTATADEHIPEHGHMLVQRPQIGIVTVDGVDYVAAVGFRGCVDLAGNRALHLGAHHERMHFGTAGAMLDAKAGHAVVPTTPFGDWDDCAGLRAALPIIFGPA